MKIIDLFPNTLVGRMIVLPFFMILLAFLLMGSVLGSLQYHYFYKDLENQSLMIGKEVTTSIDKYLLLNDFGEIELLMVRFCESKDILSMTLVDEQGNGLIHVQDDLQDKHKIQYNTSISLPENLLLNESISVENLKSIYIFNPLGNNTKPLWIRIEVDKVKIYQHLLNLLTVGIIVVLGFSMVVSWLMIKIFKIPFEQIQEIQIFSTTLSEAKGNQLNHTWEVKEIVCLVNSLNELSTKLYENEQIKDQYNHQLLAFNEKLSLRVAEEVEKNRTKEIMLMNQARLAALGEMIGNIAHQWRQPLNVISIILINMQMEYELGEISEGVFRDFVQQMTAQVEYLSQTIEDFRNLVKPDKVNEPFLLHEAIHKVMDIYSTILKVSNINVVLELDPLIRIEHGGSKLFIQVLLTLLSNAKDAFEERLDQKDKLIRIRTFINEEEVKALECSDNAGGISNENIQKIFDPYFTTKHQSLGTGLGLYIAKNIVENELNGTITVQNQNGGTCFTLHCR